MMPTKPSSSPVWSSNSKRLVLLVLLALGMLALYRVRGLLLPLSVAVVLAYLVDPVVRLLTRHTPLPRIFNIILIYLLIIAGLVSIPVSAITPIVNQIVALINNTPRYIRQLGEFFQEPIVIVGTIEIPIDQLSLDQAFVSLSSNLVDVVQTVGGRTITIFGSLASATISTLGWIVIILFISFYLVKDYRQLFKALIDATPPSYQEDVQRLLQEISHVWHAFLRGQLVLCVVVGILFLLIALIIGLPNAIVLAIFAGIMELIPTFGPILAAVPAVLVAFVQTEASWVGRIMSPFWFGMLVLAIYGVIYQFENYYLVPRIIGHHLKLHPLVVIVGVLVGASVAGVLGVLLAAPVVATLRLVLRYIYAKLTDQPPFPDRDEAPASENAAAAVVPPTEASNIGPVSSNG